MTRTIASASCFHFAGKLLLPGAGQPVILELAIAILGSFPFRGDPALALEAMQRWVKRSVLDLQYAVRGSLDVLGDLVSVRRTEQERTQDEHVESALKQFDPVRRLLPSYRW
jgi:hypothetical protein